MHSTLDEMSATSRKSRSHKEHERQELEERVLRLTGELDRAKTEVCGCQRMFHMRDMHTGYTAQVTQWQILMANICGYQYSWRIPHYSFVFFSPLHYSPPHHYSNLMFKIVAGIHSFFKFALTIRHYKRHVLLCRSSAIGHSPMSHTTLIVFLVLP